MEAVRCGRAWAVGTRVPTGMTAARQRAALINQFCSSYLSVSRRWSRSHPRRGPWPAGRRREVPMASLPAPAAQRREQLSGTGHPSDHPRKPQSMAQRLHLPCTSPKAQTPWQDPRAAPEAGQHGEVHSKAGKGNFCLASFPPILRCLTTNLAALGHAAAVSSAVMGGHYCTHVTSKASAARKIQGSMTVPALSAPNRSLQLQMQRCEH